MPDVAGGWLCSLLGASGEILGGKLYIFGVAGYITPIWDVLALQGERDGAGQRLWGAKLIKYFPIRQPVPVGLARARFCWLGSLGSVFHGKKLYITSYNVLTCNVIFYIRPGRREWVDALG